MEGNEDVEGEEGATEEPLFGAERRRVIRVGDDFSTGL